MIRPLTLKKSALLKRASLSNRTKPQANATYAFSTLEIGLLAFGFIVIASLVTSVIHGASGIAGGFLMAAALTPIIGIKTVMLALSMSVLITLIVPAVPAVFLVGSLYGSLSSSFVADLLGVVMLASLCLRRIAYRVKFKVRRLDFCARLSYNSLFQFRTINYRTGDTGSTTWSSLDPWKLDWAGSSTTTIKHPTLNLYRNVAGPRCTEFLLDRV